MSRSQRAAFADEVGESAVADIPPPGAFVVVPVFVVEAVLALVVFLVEEPAAVDAGERGCRGR
ncbi:hypothetical protein [Streptomyces sp. NRRL S-350]|uniref:hypothetical protein n=1 Tax=Streptomyces sp. NRRL S-350 TaxID=1463902 RepID=UPI0004BE8359|nr:hypothetical protein [Streptomyces sp. NRRL S-350]